MLRSSSYYSNGNPIRKTPRVKISPKWRVKSGSFASFAMCIDRSTRRALQQVQHGRHDWTSTTSVKSEASHGSRATTCRTDMVCVDLDRKPQIGGTGSSASRRDTRCPFLRLPVLTGRTLRSQFIPRRRFLRFLLFRLPFEPAFVLWFPFTRGINLLLIIYSTSDTLLLLWLCLSHISTRILYTDGGLRLLLLRRVEVGRYALPSLVRFSSQLLHHCLPRDLVLLLLYGWCVFAGVAKPLVPLCCFSCQPSSTNTSTSTSTYAISSRPHNVSVRCISQFSSAGSH